RFAIRAHHRSELVQRRRRERLGVVLLRRREAHLGDGAARRYGPRLLVRTTCHDQHQRQPHAIPPVCTRKWRAGRGGFANEKKNGASRAERGEVAAPRPCRGACPRKKIETWTAEPSLATMRIVSTASPDAFRLGMDEGDGSDPRAVSGSAATRHEQALVERAR